MAGTERYGLLPPSKRVRPFPSRARLKGGSDWLASLDLRERVTGIEPAPPAWKAGALPLSYTRGAASLATLHFHGRLAHGASHEKASTGRFRSNQKSPSAPARLRPIHRGATQSLGDPRPRKAATPTESHAASSTGARSTVIALKPTADRRSP